MIAFQKTYQLTRAIRKYIFSNLSELCFLLNYCKKSKVLGIKKFSFFKFSFLIPETLGFLQWIFENLESCRTNLNEPRQHMQGERNTILLQPRLFKADK